MLVCFAMQKQCKYNPTVRGPKYRGKARDYMIVFPAGRLWGEFKGGGLRKNWICLFS